MPSFATEADAPLVGSDKSSLQAKLYAGVVTCFGIVMLTKVVGWPGPVSQLAFIEEDELTDWVEAAMNTTQGRNWDVICGTWLNLGRIEHCLWMSFSFGTLHAVALCPTHVQYAAFLPHFFAWTLGTIMNWAAVVLPNDYVYSVRLSYVLSVMDPLMMIVVGMLFYQSKQRAAAVAAQEENSEKEKPETPIIFKVFAGLMLVYAAVLAASFFTFPGRGAWLSGESREDVQAWATAVRTLPDGRPEIGEIMYGILTCFAIIYHTNWFAHALGTAHTIFLCPAGHCYPQFFSVSLAFTVATYTHWQSLFFASQYVYAVPLNKVLGFVDPLMMVLGWACFAISRSMRD